MLTTAAIDRVVRLALDEDAPWGDLTSEALIPAGAVARAELVAREAGVFSGGDVFRAAFTTADSRIQVEILAEEGGRFDAGARLARIDGPARSVLTAERVALNLVQRMCGVSTLTARFVDAVRDTPARIVDTRKTTPGLRALERHAVIAGGGRNHRYSLSDWPKTTTSRCWRGGRSPTCCATLESVCPTRRTSRWRSITSTRSTP